MGGTIFSKHRVYSYFFNAFLQLRSTVCSPVHELDLQMVGRTQGIAVTIYQGFIRQQIVSPYNFLTSSPTVSHLSHPHLSCHLWLHHNKYLGRDDYQQQILDTDHQEDRHLTKT